MSRNKQTSHVWYPGERKPNPYRGDLDEEFWDEQLREAEAKDDLAVAYPREDRGRRNSLTDLPVYELTLNAMIAGQTTEVLRGVQNAVICQGEEVTWFVKFFHQGSWSATWEMVLLDSRVDLNSPLRSGDQRTLLFKEHRVRGYYYSDDDPKEHRCLFECATWTEVCTVDCSLKLIQPRGMQVEDEDLVWGPQCDIDTMFYPVARLFFMHSFFMGKNMGKPLLLDQVGDWKALEPVFAVANDFHPGFELKV